MWNWGDKLTVIPVGEIKSSLNKNVKSDVTDYLKHFLPYQFSTSKIQCKPQHLQYFVGTIRQGNYLTQQNKHHSASSCSILRTAGTVISVYELCYGRDNHRIVVWPRHMLRCVSPPKLPVRPQPKQRPIQWALSPDLKQPGRNPGH
jgi:hypothetical protein